MEIEERTAPSLHFREREREKRVYGEREKVARVQKETVHFVTDVSPAGHLSVSSGNVIMI